MTQYGHPMIDALRLPEGVELASRGRRTGAWFLSALLAIVTLGIGYIIWGAIVWGKGTSPAYQVLGMKTWKPVEQTRGTWGTMFMKHGLLTLLNAVCGVITLRSEEHTSELQSH